MLNQLVVNGIVAASVYCLIGVGFAIVYNTSRFFNFAHGVVFTAGAYFTYLFTAWLGLSLSISILLAVAASGLLGCLIEWSIYRPLRRKGSSPLILLLSSLGIYIILQNTISMVFGDGTKAIHLGVVKEGFKIFGASITTIQILIICVNILLVVAISIFFRKTMMGKAMRAVANDPELAQITGIESDRVILWASGLGSVSAGLAGIMVALDVHMTPMMGMNALMMGIVAVIIGGIGSIPGVVLGALLLGLTQHVGVWKISSQWQDAVPFLVLFLFLLFKPEGFVGRRVARNTV